MRALLLGAALLAAPAFAHDGVTHYSDAEARAHEAPAPPDGPALPFPVEIGGPFALTDQHGRPRTEADPDGRMQLLFFGYAECQAICTAALPLMADTAALAEEAGTLVTPVMITVDPDRDTPEAMATRLGALHPRMLGLTGDEAALEAARKAFSVERKLAFEDPELGAVYAHGSFVYLLSAAGEVLSVLPPILSAERGAQIVAKYAGAGL